MKLEALVAEFIGTFTLIFAGVGAIAVASGHEPSAALLCVALAHGLALVAMVTATAAISGGHLNPAVTFAVLVAGKIKPFAAVGYVAAQCLGALAAAALLSRIMPAWALADFGSKIATLQLATGVTPAMGVMMEAVLTFFLVFVVFGTAVDHRAPKLGGLFIGLTVTMDILVGGPITGAAMNPARHLGPAVIARHFDKAWVYWVGPLAGAFLAAVVYRFVMEPSGKKV